MMSLKLLYLLSMLIQVYCEQRMICYWMNDQSIESIDPSLCTHIHYSFATLDQNSLLIRFEDSNREVDIIQRVNNLKSVNPNLKIILALGGWVDSAGDKYSRMVSDPRLRASFVQQSTEFLKQYSFDGLDLDWEFPVCWQTVCDAGPQTDKQNFASLLQELRASFDRQEPKLSLSTAVNGGQWLADVAYDYSVLNSSLDYVNIMTYDNAGMWAGKTGHHSGFDWSTNTMNWWSTHITRSKLLMGVPFYGISFTLQDPNQHEIGAPVTASSAERFSTICNNVKNNGWTNELVDADGPIAYKRNQWVGYDEPNSILRKAQWIRKNGYGGILIWEISQDDIKGTCCVIDRPLLRAANYGLFQKGSDPITYQCE